MGKGPEGQGGGGSTPELISTNEKPKKTGPLSPAGKQDCPSLKRGVTSLDLDLEAIRRFWLIAIPRERKSLEGG